MNPFDSPLAARLYARGRPFPHPLVADLFRPHVPAKVAHALDVACGTGLSARILLEFADQVAGCDASQPMLDAAFQDPRLTYHCATATAMPFDDEHFGLITLGSGLHWLEADAFLREAQRLLAPGGQLVIYDHGFTGQMACRPDYQTWHREQFLARFPAPPRSVSTLPTSPAATFGFTQTFQTGFEHHWPMSVASHADYLLTQSNVLLPLHNQATTPEEVRGWIQATTLDLFRLPQETFRFAGRVTIFRRAPSTTSTYPLRG